MKISVLKDFNEFPALRHCNISDLSGEEFYHNVLNIKFKEALIKNIILTVDLDNTAGYASSFLDEAFGNLVYDFTLDKVRNLIKIISEQEPHWKEMIFEKTFIEWENRRLEKIKPIVTENHKPWFRIINNKIENEIWELPSVAK